MILPEGAQEYIKLQRTNIDPNDYGKHIVDDFKMIEPYLEGVESVLDIGCGLGLIDTLIAKKGIHVTLYDKDETWDGLLYGFNNEEYYNSMDLTQKTLELNDVTGVVTTKLPKRSFDLAISLLSWGYHYPLKTYQPKAKRYLVDIRKNYEVIPTNATIIDEDYKRARVIFDSHII